MEGFAIAEISEFLRQEGVTIWLDLHDPDPVDLAVLTDEFGLHPLAVEDAVQRHDRPKLDRYPDHLFLSAYAVRLDEVCSFDPAIRDPGNVTELHDMRIAAKRLRYALELTGELRLARTASLVARLRGMQDVLGELHDLDVLRAEAGRVRTALPLDSIVARDLERLSGDLDAAIRLLHARYLRGARALASLTDRVRDRIAPCLDPSIST